MTSLEVRALHKYFGATHALRGVNLVLRAGQVHALLGANGCGKSTLVKILAGYHQPDAGEILGLSRSSIAFVHQDLGLVPALSVTENLALAAGFGPGPAIRWGREHRRAEDLMRRYEIACDVRQPVGALGPAEQTMIAIARALAGLPDSGGVLVLDEPTARLPASEADRLLEMLQRLRQRGVAVLYISHRLEEVLQLANEVTVLRDGAVVHNGPVDALDRETLVRLIVGDDLPTPEASLGRTLRQHARLLDVRDLRGLRLRDVSLSLGRGEVLGIAGLVGSGRSELGRLIYGLQKVASGSVTLDGRDITNIGAVAAVRKGLAYVPQERRNGLFQGLSVGENAVLAELPSLMRGIALSSEKALAEAQRVVGELQVKTAGLDVPIETLSGGNQQKVSLGKWLRRRPRLLILDEPTQGVDVGARTEIFHVIRRMARELELGALVLDSDLEILAEHCDRVLIMAQGRIVRSFEGTDITAAALSHAVYGH